MNEVSISSARASVMVYDDVNKKWVPSGSSSGLSKVQLYHHQVNNTFRVVGRKLQDHEIVINCAILKGLKYNQATVTFHQWRDNKQVYGLNFSSKDDADAFARAMLQALDVLSNGSNISRSLGPAVAPAAQQQPVYQQQPQQQQQQQPQPQPQPQQQQPQQQQQQAPNAQYEEDMGYSQGHSTRVSLSLGHLPAGGQAVLPVGPPTPTPSHHPSVSGGTATVIQLACPRGSPADAPMRTMTREDVAIIQERRMSQQNQVTNSPIAISPSCPPTSQQQQQQQQQQSGHHRTSSAPPAPQPQQQNNMQPMQGPMIPAAPQMANAGGPPVPPPQPPIAPPAPPCPPMMNFNAPVPPPMMMNQYAQSPSTQSNLSNQSQSQTSIYGSNQGPQYGGATGQSGQYTNATAVGQSPGQYAGNPSGLYGNNGQNVVANSVYATTQSAAPGGQYAASAGGQGSQYGGGGAQYGSNSSLGQYAAASPAAGQYAAGGGGQQAPTGQYAVATQYGPGQLPQQPVSAAVTNPYGTPANSVNHYAGTGAGHLPASANSYAPVASGGPPPPPMGPPLGPTAAPPPPPPPPVPNASSVNVSSGPNASSASSADPPPDANSLAAALQAARLKKKQQSQPVENSGSSTSSSGSGAGNYGTLGRGGGGGMASMMDEMAKTLARRRAAVEKKQPEQPPEPESSPDKKSWDKSSSSTSKFSNGAESPKSVRKRFGSASEDTLLKVNGVNDGSPLTTQEMEAFKAELIREVRKEFQKMKQEIVDAVKAELSRR